MDTKKIKLTNAEIDGVAFALSKLIKEKGHGFGYEWNKDFLICSPFIDSYSKMSKSIKEPFLLKDKAVLNGGSFVRMDDGTALKIGESKQSIVDPEFMEEYLEAEEKLKEETHELTLHVIKESKIKALMKKGGLEGINIAFLLDKGLIA